MRTICHIDGCERKEWARGWCRLHYGRWYIHGDPNTVLVKQSPSGAPMKFIEKAITHAGSDCLLWPFAKNNMGYPQINVANNKKVLVSRIICEKVNGPPPTDTHQAAHSCGNGHLGCISPNHLRWATPVENKADEVLHGTRLRGTMMGNSKLSEASVLLIFERVSAGEVQQVIADEYGINQKTVSYIKRGIRWGWLTQQHGAAA